MHVFLFNNPDTLTTSTVYSLLIPSIIKCPTSLYLLKMKTFVENTSTVLKKLWKYHYKPVNTENAKLLFVVLVEKSRCVPPFAV